MVRIRTALRVLALSASALAIACGDGERQLSATASLPETGGTESDAGTNKHSGGTTHTSSSVTSTGGNYQSDAGTTGGGSNAGGSGTVASSAGGTSNGGNSSSIGGAGTTVGGRSVVATAGGTSAADTSAGGSLVGGDTSFGGNSTGAQTSSGGTSSADTSSLGGDTSVGGITSLGGDTSVGGSALGGNSSATGGDTAISTGGTTATGGVAATGGSSTTSVPCNVSFVVPADGSALSNSSDSDKDCSNGIQMDVSVVTNAAQNTPATLTLTSGSNASTTHNASVGGNLQAIFPGVDLPASGTATLTATIGSSFCMATANLTLDCAGPPSCSITRPTINQQHPELNGVPIASGGDRSSADGAPYQTPIEVHTDAADGQPVTLTIDGVTPPPVNALSGKATFASMALGADGNHAVFATCTGRNGQSSSTVPGIWTVDTQSPRLSVTKVLGGPTTPVTSALVDGDHFSTVDDADTLKDGLQIQICGSTTSSDAVDLSQGLSYSSNFCVALGGNNPDCLPVTSAASGTACAILDCPGNGAFDVNITLKDTAGNPTTITKNNITCAASTPTVSFVDPTAGTAPNQRILAADNPTATLKDKDPNTAGAQYDVKICTSAISGSASLAIGIAGNALTNWPTPGTWVPDTNGQLCGGDFPTQVVFSNVTLPDSVTNAAFNLAQATRLKATVNDDNQAQGTATADIWVDSKNPTLTINSPSNLCGLYINNANPPVNQTVTFGTSIVPVQVLIEHADGTSSSATASSLSFYQTSTTVELASGLNTLKATVTMPSGNSGNISGCQITVGTSPPPKVTWVTPIASSVLTAPGSTATGAIADRDTMTSDWQGTLKVCTDLDVSANPDATVQFSVNGSALGSPVALDSSGCATLSDATIPEGTAVQITATTSPALVGGVGSSSIAPRVDATIPGTPTGLTAVVKERRQTSFTLAWTAPADGPQNAAGYDIRVATVPITATNFDDPTVTQSVAFSGTPAASGSLDGMTVSNRYIETDYYFGLRATDAAGNKSPIAATSNAVRASFLTTILPAPVTGLRFGATIDGTGDFDGDGLSDLVVGHVAGRQVYLYFGAKDVGPATTPDVTLTSNNNSFGFQAANIGDVNGDGIQDLAVSTWAIGTGHVVIFYGKPSWPTVLAESSADVSITPDPGQPGGAGFTSSRFGYALARLGDFNGDGVDDFAIGASGYNSGQGHVSIILGKKGGLAPAINVPQAFSSGQAIRLDGDTSVAGYFGATLTGLGAWYSQPASPVVIISAPSLSTTGRIYSFAGTSGTPQSIPLGSAVNVIDGSAGSALGGSTIHAGGDIGYAGKQAILVPDPAAAPGYADVFSGADSEGPFGRLVRYTTTDVSPNTLDFARLMLSSAIPGTNGVSSFIGDARADLVVSTTAGTGPRIFIINGAKVSSQFATPASVSVQSVADVVFPMPTGWIGFAKNCLPARDVDGDGYGDLALGDIGYSTATVNYDGRVLVLH